jgi:hypothetical protein
VDVSVFESEDWVKSSKPMWIGFIQNTEDVDKTKWQKKGKPAPSSGAGTSFFSCLQTYELQVLSFQTLGNIFGFLCLTSVLKL